MSTVTHKVEWKDLGKVLLAAGALVGAGLVGTYHVIGWSFQGYDTAIASLGTSVSNQGASIARLDERIGEQSSLMQGRFNDMDHRFTLLTEDVAKAEQRLQDQIDGLENQNRAILAQLEGVARELQGLTGEFRDLREEIGPASYKPESAPGIEFQTAPKRQAIPQPTKPSTQRDLTIPMVNLNVDESSRVATADSRRSLRATYTSPVVTHHSGSLKRGMAKTGVRASTTPRTNRVAARAVQKVPQMPRRSFNFVEHPAFMARLARLVPQGSVVMIAYSADGQRVSQSFRGNAQNDAGELAEFIGVPTGRLFPGIVHNFDCTGLEDTVPLSSLVRELYALCKSDEEQTFDFRLLITDHISGMFGVESFDDVRVGPMESSLRPKIRPATLTP